VHDPDPTGADRSAAVERDRYAAMLRRLPGFVYQTTASPGNADRFTYMSSLTFLTGHRVEHWYDDGEAWTSLVHPDEADAVGAANRAAIETGMPFQMVFRAKRVDGAWMWILDTAQVHHETNGDHVWTGFCQDVTERFRLERAREVHVRRLLLLLEHIHAVVYEIDQRGLVYVSPGSVCGRQAQEYLADPELWTRAVHPDDLRRVQAQLAATIRRGAETAFDFRMVQPDGSVVEAINALVPYIEADGSTTFIGFVLDVSERRKAEESAEIALHQLRLAVEHAGVVPYELEGARIQLRSGGRVTRLLVHPHDQAAFDRAHDDARLGNRPVSLEFRFRAEGGDWRWGLARASRVRDDPSADTVSGVLIDTTRERKLSERWREIEAVLTPRERQAFLLLGRGATNNDIARSLGITHSTATHHVARVLAKLGLSNRAVGAALASELRASLPIIDATDGVI
jgi:PAS domain S-box-containing protein